MISQGDSDRRQGLRVDFDTEVTVSAENGTKKYKGSSRDLSLRGVFIYTDDQLEIKTACSIEILLLGMKDELILMMDGHVVREEEKGYAIYFDSVDLDSYTHLKNIVKYNAPDSDGV